MMQEIVDILCGFGAEKAELEIGVRVQAKLGAVRPDPSEINYTFQRFGWEVKNSSLEQANYSCELMRKSSVVRMWGPGIKQCGVIIGGFCALQMSEWYFKYNKRPLNSTYHFLGAMVGLVVGAVCTEIGLYYDPSPGTQRAAKDLTVVKNAVLGFFVGTAFCEYRARRQRKHFKQKDNKQKMMTKDDGNNT